MSDYLWDKTGGADPEIERLEELLGELRYRPREFKLPPEVATRNHAAAPNIRSFNSHRAYAAALLLVLFAGLWFVTQRHSGEANEASVAPSPQDAPSVRDEEVRQSQLAQEDKKTIALSRQNISTVPPVERGVKLTKREMRGALKTQDALAATKTSNRDRRVQMVPATFSADEQRQAKAQLMYALRLTSAKLGELQPKRGETNTRPDVPRERNLMR